MSSLSAPREEAQRLLDRLGVPRSAFSNAATGAALPVTSPIDGLPLATVRTVDAAGAHAGVAAAHAAHLQWRDVPAPRRGELVRLLGEELRASKDDLGHLVTLETGKIRSEGLGEVQEMIDICDYAVGLSRQLFGLTMATERRHHRMMETWHPAGVVAVISAFNFPVAVWSWNAALAFVCGDSVAWKPSEKAPLTALAVQALFERAASRFGDAPANLSTLLVGGREAGEVLVDDARIPIVSATGSIAMGRLVGPRVAARFGRSILELGGNNAAIVCPSANLDLSLRGKVHGGARATVDGRSAAYYAAPALVEVSEQSGVMCHETFAPILYVQRYRDLGDAIRWHNEVPQGLSSSIFTNDLREAERFLSAAGSDCGIANVNIGPSGAEIGGAFGGAKETGGGREAVSDSWKAYMRRATNTINYGNELPLAQGVKFDIA